MSRLAETLWFLVAGRPPRSLYSAAWAALAAHAAIRGYGRELLAWSGATLAQSKTEILPPPGLEEVWGMLPGTGRLQASDTGGWKRPPSPDELATAVKAALEIDHLNLQVPEDALDRAIRARELLRLARAAWPADAIAVAWSYASSAGGADALAAEAAASARLMSLFECDNWRFWRGAEDIRSAEIGSLAATWEKVKQELPPELLAAAETYAEAYLRRHGLRDSADED